MSERDWLFFIAVGGILAFGLAFAALQNERQNKCAGCYPASAQQYDCAYYDFGVRTVKGSVVDAPPTNPYSDREEWRKEQDLQAQRDMADWAFWVMIFSGLSVGVTAIGVRYVAKTLDATRETIRIASKANGIAGDAAKSSITEARKMAEAARAANALTASTMELTRTSNEHQLRAYVAVNGVSGKSRASYILEPEDEHKRTLVLTIDVTNHGQTPALNVSIELVNAHISEIEEDISHRGRCIGASRYMALSQIDMGRIEPHQTRSISIPIEYDISTHQDGDGEPVPFCEPFAFFLDIAVTYNTVFPRDGKREVDCFFSSEEIDGVQTLDAQIPFKNWYVREAPENK